ncbi:MAG: protein kinase [Planctomycetaceae bacterium]|nr:protein kinase [Planctomycetaceae bacterium]
MDKEFRIPAERDSPPALDAAAVIPRFVRGSCPGDARNSDFKGEIVGPQMAAAAADRHAIRDDLDPSKSMEIGGDTLKGDDLDQIYDRFDEQWHAGRSPNLADFVDCLPNHNRTKYLAELAAIDLEYRWKTSAAEMVPTNDGNTAAIQASSPALSETQAATARLPGRPEVEDYISRWPELVEEPEIVAWLAAEEFRARLRWGPPPDVSEFLERFGDLQGLKEQLAVVRQEWELDGQVTVAESLGTTVQEFSPDDASAVYEAGEQPNHRYAIQKLLGEGGMGKVFLAYDHTLGRRVAIKVPRMEIQGLVARDRFRAEVRSAARLRHPGVCPIYDAGEFGGRPYLTMAYIEGHTLQELWRGGETGSVPERLAILAQVATAMEAAHLAGIVHRDLKPSNIMIDLEGHAVVTDFGLARLTTPEDERITRTGDSLGSPAYMSPEQIEGTAADVGPSSDIYSLGVILFEALTERLPFSGRASAVHVGIARDAPPAPGAVVADVDPELDALCVSMLSKQPADRPVSMRQVSDLLEAIRVRMESGIDPRLQHSGPDRSRRAGPAAAVTAAGLVLIGTVAIAIHLFRRSDEATEAPMDAVGGRAAIVDVGPDDGGPARDQTIVRSSPSSRPEGRALRFDGIDDYVLTPVALDRSQPFTLEAWVAPADPYGTGPVISNANATGLLLGQQFDERLGLHLWTSWAAEAGRFSVRSDHPHEFRHRRTHLAAVWDGTLLSTYVDGRRLPGTGELLPQVAEVARPLVIGSKYSGDGLARSSEGWFSGEVDDVRISNRARYTDDFTPPQRFVADAGTMGLYLFDEPTGDMAVDASGRENHATIFGPERVSAVTMYAPSPLAAELASFGTAVRRPTAERNGPALHFTGGDAEARLDEHGVNLVEPFTLEVWVTPDADFEWRDWKRVCVSLDSFSVSIPRFHEVYTVGTWSAGGGVSVAAYPQRTAAAERRTHVAGQWTGDNLELFVNGRRAPSAMSLRNLSADESKAEIVRVLQLASEGPLVLGRRINGKGELGGRIDRFRLSVGIRYADDFEPAEFGSDAATAVLYDFHEGEGDILHDVSGHGRHAHIRAADWVAVGEKP